ncbi:AraC family transcriptional regulator [Chromobacterium phragmitis]|uniref:AraC family transcriptional regulator n=2 Tax=Chromobacterium phragmitis TaxID=2202141 RepID=A0A344UNY6_9NEIS|nr:AraC family transcriptional regulator [Chromobacterium phragmitis]AXE36984.1 AraC family transcriptional regulator [Chromobacterium phragmitis]
MLLPIHLPVFPSGDIALQPVSRHYPDHYETPAHWHEGAQLVYAASGVMELRCEAGFWTISPQQALWVPAGMPHRLLARGAVELRTVYLAAQACSPGLPERPVSLAVSPLLRELILHAPAVERDAACSRDAHLLQLLLDEIRLAQAQPPQWRAPRDGRLRKVCQRLLRDPGDDRTLAAWGQWAGASPRTLSRLFLAEFGMSFSKWRQQARIFAAIPRLEQGEAVARVSADLGYLSISAFTAAFRRLTGRPPGAFHKPLG